MTMKASLFYAWGRMIRFIGQSALIVIGVAAILNYAPMVEPWLFPVLREQIASDVTRSGNVVRFFIEADKVRDCRIERVSWVVSQGYEQSPIVVDNATGLPVSGEAIYGPGHLRLGPFSAVLPRYFANADFITGAILYNCHAGWLVRQEFGPVQVPPAAG